VIHLAPDLRRLERLRRIRRSQEPDHRGDKYANVSNRSVSAVIEAPSQTPRAGPRVRHAATRLPIVSSVRGSVVTNAQNRRPVSEAAAAAGSQCGSPSASVVNQSGRTMRCS
jgi:hypothetical protein